MSQLVKLPGIKVFDFHPIHIFLNTEDISRYEKTREWHRDPQKLKAYRFDGKGTRTHFLDLLT